MSHRNLSYLNNNRIIYRRYSSDNPTSSHGWGWYYADGTHGYYALFDNKAKINTIRSLKWHLLTLWYLNPELDKTKFIQLAEYIIYKKNGFVTFSIGSKLINQIIEENHIKGIVIGNPINMDGTSGKSSQSACDFAKNLSKNITIHIAMWDERLSSEGSFKITKVLGTNVSI